VEIQPASPESGHVIHRSDVRKSLITESSRWLCSRMSSSAFVLV
jgi:hypothetical protein